MDGHPPVPPGTLRRRTFLWDLGLVAAAVVVGGCTQPDDDPTDPATGGSKSGPGTSTAPASPSPAASGAAAGYAWERIDGVGAAYVLARGGEAVVVDTGVAGNADNVEAGLAALSLTWDAVGAIILTHSHPDHQGSLIEVAQLAAVATLHAGGADIPAITAPEGRELLAVATGDRVMDLEVVSTPGHTPGHISVFDPTGRILVAGDAINGNDAGGVGSPNARFTADMAAALESVAALQALSPDTILFGHGQPAVADAAAALAAVAGPS